MKSFGLWLKGVALSCAVVSSVWCVPAITHAAVPALDADVKIQVNQDLIHFPDAQPYVDGNHRTQVPVRFVTEKLGYQVDWHQSGDHTSVTLTGENGHTVTLTTGTPIATVNGSVVLLDTSPSVANDRVFVPLRFVSEVAGINVHWDNQNGIATLLSGSAKTAQASASSGWSEVTPLGTFDATAYSGAAEENSGYAGLDYFGGKLQLGTVAVDPNVIPLGTKLYMEGYNYDGLPAGGMVVTARDIGGGVDGRHLDIYLPGSRSEIRSFGIQKIKVYRLND